MNTKVRIREVAAGLFAERGFDGVSVRDITGVAGTNLGSITYHFGSKEGLFAAVVAHKIQPLAEIGRRVATSNLPPKEKLRQLLLESVMHILHHDPSMKVFFAEAIQGGTRLPEEAVASIRQRNELISAILQEGIDRGDFKPCDLESASWIFFGMLTPYVLHEPLINPEHRRGAYPAEFVQRIVDEALDIFFHGVEAGG